MKILSDRKTILSLWPELFFHTQDIVAQPLLWKEDKRDAITIRLRKTPTVGAECFRPNTSAHTLMKVLSGRFNLPLRWGLQEENISIKGLFKSRAVKYSTSIVILSEAKNLLPVTWLRFIYRFFLRQNDNSVRLTETENRELNSPSLQKRKAAQ